MSTDVGNRLTEQIRTFFDGNGLAGKVGAAFVLVTTDPDGSPRPCMLSAGEVWAQADRALRLALWPGTHTGQNLERRSTALFCFVWQGHVTYVQGRTRSLRSPAEAKAELECFELAADEVRTDEHPGMPVTSGICFELTDSDRDSVLAAWQRQIDLLRHAE